MALKLWRRKASGNWYVTGSVRRERYTESTGTRSRTHAEAYRVKREREILDGTYLNSAATIFSAAALVYIEKGGEKRFLDPLIARFGPMRLTDITPEMVSTVARELYGQQSAATAKRQFYTPLNSVMRAAHRAQMAPLFRFDPPKVKRKAVTQYASDEWLEQFFAHAGFRIACTVLFITLTGARVSEACRLVPEDVLIDRAEAILRITKNGRPRRAPMPPVLVEAMQRALVELVKPIKGVDRVFGYASRFSVNQAIERACARAGITYMSSHKVGRHAFAARLLAKGQSLKLVQEAGGWAQIQVVSESYGHLEQQAIDDAVRGAAGDYSMPARRLPKPEKVPKRKQKRGKG